MQADPDTPPPMSAHPLTRLFNPASVAIVGAGEDAGRVGAAVMRNLAAGGFRGALYPVNPRHARVLDRQAYPSLDALPAAPDLVVLATPPATLPDLVAAAGARGAGAVAILSSGLTDRTPDDAGLLARVAEVARDHRVRVLGPNSLGLLRPSIGLNASFAGTAARPGAMALVSQSGGLVSAMLDWAMADGLGFSSVISLGNQLDVDFAEALDFLTNDAQTDSIALYVESVHGARRFMSALRAAARIKPVVVLKSGRGPAGSLAASTHTGAMASPDEAFDAALRRAGAVRVANYTQLFGAAKYLSSRFRPVGHHLAIVTNGGGPGVMAVDRATESGLAMAEFAPDTVKTLDALLPQSWSRSNPVDVLEDAGPERFRRALDACLSDPGTDGVVAIVTPQAMTDTAAVAKAIAETSTAHYKPLIACFMGEATVAGPRQSLQAAGVPTFRSPDPAVEAFAYIVAFYANQRLLMQVPGPLDDDRRPPDIEGARRLIDTAVASGQRTLSETDSKAVLAAFGIPVAQTVVTHSADEAVEVASRIGFPVVMKIHSDDVTHKSDVGGVRLNVTTPDQVRAAWSQIGQNVLAARPDARVAGIAIEPMIVKPNGREIMVGVLRDPVFGPLIALGAGGTQVELISDRAVALPPLNGLLARNLIDRTRVAATLAAWRGMPAADLDALEEVLLRVSEMVCELPWLEQLDINPLILDEHGAVAADARLVLAAPADDPCVDRYAHMAICPYPGHLVRTWTMRDGREVTVRPIRPEDAEMEQAFVVHGMSDESRYYRFANALHELSDKMLVRFTQIDYDRELALVAVVHEDDGDRQVGVARYVIDPGGTSCEFALAIADAIQGQGVGGRLLTYLMDVARTRGLREMVGYVLGQNTRMLHLMTKLGFAVMTDPDDNSMRIVVRRLAE